jgi:hypothetical protein
MATKPQIAEQGYRILKGAVIATLVVAALNKFSTDWNHFLGFPDIAWQIWGIVDVILAIGIYKNPKLYGNLAGIWGIILAILFFFLPFPRFAEWYYLVALFVINATVAFALAKLAEVHEIK